MKASDLSRELRRIAQREVPNGEPNLWPSIRQQLERAGASSGPRRSGAALDASYVWHANTPRRRHFGTLPATLAGTLVVIVLVAGLALAFGNRANDSETPAGIGNVPQSTHVATPTSEWPSNGKLTIPINPVNGADISGEVTAQLLPGGDLRLAGSTNALKKLVTMHLVANRCDRASADIPSKTDLISPFTPNNGYYAFVPEAATHQPLALAALYLSDNTLAGCAIIPPVPNGMTPHFTAASDVPSTCPVTLPGSAVFTPPGESAASPHPIYGDYWYGDAKLWTSLPFDGVWNGGKSFWWSEGYNFITEQRPALTVSGKRLDGPGSAGVSRATNGNGGGAGSFMLVGVDFPTPGCWQVTGTYKGDAVTFVVWVDHPFPMNMSAPTATPIPTPSPTQTPNSSALTCSNLSILTRFIDAFNANDQATLTAILPESALGGNRWLAAVTTSHLNLMSGNVLAMTRDDFLSYVTARHQQHERLSFDGVLETTQANTIPMSENVIIQMGRTADDIGVEHVKAVASLSCAEQQVTAWSVGDTLDTSDTIVPTGEDLVSQTLHARDLHVHDIALSGGVCPVDLPHTVDPGLGPALGDGPLYVVMGQADEQGVNHLHDAGVKGDWYLFKELWTSDPSYNGPVLVRGKQIDGTAEMRFGDNFPPDLTDSYYFTAPHGNTVQITYASVNTPGCYAYQVDGINFSELIVTSFAP